MQPAKHGLRAPWRCAYRTSTPHPARPPACCGGRYLSFRRVQLCEQRVLELGKTRMHEMQLLLLSFVYRIRHLFRIDPLLRPVRRASRVRHSVTLGNASPDGRTARSRLLTRSIILERVPKPFQQCHLHFILIAIVGSKLGREDSAPRAESVLCGAQSSESAITTCKGLGQGPQSLHRIKPVHMMRTACLSRQHTRRRIRPAAAVQ